ncbi:hypothetical protein BaRGS_00011370 [Batillaria attramentaria]|uniref:Secreted protein n=1 Tax=Batillaria attramentaria TaxID=370345 RepID=A0ABD0LDU0_9CAEN
MHRAAILYKLVQLPRCGLPAAMLLVVGYQCPDDARAKPNYLRTVASDSRMAQYIRDRLFPSMRNYHGDSRSVDSEWARISDCRFAPML